jgi:hypothetical protein
LGRYPLDEIMEGPQIVACVFSSDSAADAGVRALIGSGISTGEIRVGAAQGERAQALADALGAQATLDVLDPLGGTASLADERVTGAAIDRGGIMGGAIGAIVGVAVGYTHYGAIVAVAPSLRPLADALLFCALGAIAGACLGGALGPRRSTHVAYRLVDAMEEGCIGLAVSVPEHLADAVVKQLESAGATDILRVSARP